MMRSTLDVTIPRFDIAMFPGFNRTRPSHEETAATASRISDLIAPAAGPMIVADKDRGVFFVSCALKVAPLVEKTLASAIKQGLPTIGKQRSGSHVTAGAWAKLDGDGLSEEQFAAMQSTLNSAAIAHLIFSTHSHGRSDKPGIRCRIIVFFDKALQPPDYKRAVLSLSRWLLGKSLDESEARLSQQAGVWCVHPDRADRAFCIRHLDGVCVSTDALLATLPSPKQSTHTRLFVVPSVGPFPLDAERIQAALKWSDPNDYAVWFSTAPLLKAAYGGAAFPLWAAWSESADDAHKTNNGNTKRLDKLWAETTPKLSAEQAASSLFARARDAALSVARSAAETGQWGQRGRDALIYLYRYHRHLFERTFEVAA